MPKTELQELQELEEQMMDTYWVPTRGNKQKSPNAIRGEIRRFLQEKSMNQTTWLSMIGVNSNSYNRFMRGNYKDQWSACDNSTYWAAAKFLEREKIKAKYQKKAENKKRKRDTVDISSSSNSSSSSSKKAKKTAGSLLLQQIVAVDLPKTVPVYDNCDIVRKKIENFLRDNVVTQSAFLDAIGGISSNSLTSFRKYKGKGAGASNSIYPAAYRFFEQQRILEKKPKSKARKEAELNFGPQGYRLRHDDGKRWTFGGGPVDPSIFDIDAMARRRREMGSSLNINNTPFP